MLEGFKKLFEGAGSKDEPKMVLYAPVAGRAVSLQEVPDTAFSDELLGKGAAVIPTSGRVVSPLNGKVLGIFRTCHAVTLQADDGVEVLIHIGIDTVKLGGSHFTPHVEKGDRVQVGDLLIEADLEAIKAEGYNTVTATVVCNTAEYAAVEGVTGAVTTKDVLVRITPKK